MQNPDPRRRARVGPAGNMPLLTRPAGFRLLTTAFSALFALPCLMLE